MTPEDKIKALRSGQLFRYTTEIRKYRLVGGMFSTSYKLEAFDFNSPIQNVNIGDAEIRGGEIIFRIMVMGKLVTRKVTIGQITLIS